MSDYQHIVGRVGTKPEIKTTPTGKKLANFRLAVDGEWDKVTMQRPTEWYDVTVWEPLHDSVERYVDVGVRVYVSGVVSIFHGTSGDKKQIKASEIGLTTKFIPFANSYATGPVTTAAPVSGNNTPKPQMAGVTFDDEDDF